MRLGFRAGVRSRFRGLASCMFRGLASLVSKVSGFGDPAGSENLFRNSGLKVYFRNHFSKSAVAVTCLNPVSGGKFGVSFNKLIRRRSL